MRQQPLPPILKEAVGHLRYLRYRGSGEWSAECLECRDYGHEGSDDPDRMRIWDEDKVRGLGPRCWCRRCGFFKFADELVDDAPAYGLSEEAKQKAREERVRLAKQEQRRLRNKIQALQEASYWQGYHHSMTEEERELWDRRGICRYLQDHYALGYRNDYTLTWDGSEWVTPALTIPHYAHDWQIVNVQYRLQDPPPNGGKYRQTKGLPAAMFRTKPGDSLSGAVLVVEGAIKSIVLYQHLGERFLGHDFKIVGLPSKVPSSDMLEQLADAEPVYLLLDPDAYAPEHTPHGRQAPAVNRMASKLGRERVRIVKTPVKPDDLIVQYEGTGDDLKRFLKEAARA